MCNVYRLFAKEHAKVACPSLALTSSKIPDPLPPFTTTQTDAFEKLKYRLTHPPIQARLRRTGQDIEGTDARAAQVGCVLLQEKEGGSYRPV